MEIVTNPMSELRNNYWMIQKLGVGGFGKVYLIKQRENKVLRNEEIRNMRHLPDANAPNYFIFPGSVSISGSIAALTASHRTRG